MHQGMNGVRFGLVVIDDQRELSKLSQGTAETILVELFCFPAISNDLHTIRKWIYSSKTEKLNIDIHWAEPVDCDS